MLNYFNFCNFDSNLELLEFRYHFELLLDLWNKFPIWSAFSKVENLLRGSFIVFLIKMIILSNLHFIWFNELAISLILRSRRKRMKKLIFLINKRIWSWGG